MPKNISRIEREKVMKIIERMAVIIFSIIILTASILSALIIFGWISLDFVNQVLISAINNSNIYNAILIASGIFIILAIKCLFFSSNRKKDEYKSGVLLENEDGKLIISKDTIENLVNAVVRKFEGAAEAQTKVVLDSENNVTIYVTLLVKENAIIKELSSGIQTQVKETIKRTSDLEVKSINIRIKNIEVNKKDTIKKLDSPKEIIETQKVKENISIKEKNKEEIEKQAVTE